MDGTAARVTEEFVDIARPARGDERPVAAHQSPMIADGDSSPRRGLQALELLANTDADDAGLGVVDAAVAVRREG